MGLAYPPNSRKKKREKKTFLRFCMYKIMGLGLLLVLTVRRSLFVVRDDAGGCLYGFLGHLLLLLLDFILIFPLLSLIHCRLDGVDLHAVLLLEPLAPSLLVAGRTDACFGGGLTRRHIRQPSVLFCLSVCLSGGKRWSACKREKGRRGERGRKERLTPALAEVRDGLLDGPSAVQAQLLLAVVLLQLDGPVPRPAQAAARVLEGGQDDGEEGAEAHDAGQAAGWFRSLCC